MARRTKKDLQALRDWYLGVRPDYEALAQHVQRTLAQLLAIGRVPHVSVSARAKDVESFLSKAVDRKNYKNPKQDNTDFAGVRIVTFLESDVRRVVAIVRSAFELIPDKFEDKSRKLGVDRVGYKSVHMLCKLTDERIHALPECAPLIGLVFEVQVRTALQHAWAEIEHDRKYKFAGVLPEGLLRRLSLLSAVLESCDAEFDRIVAAIDLHVTESARMATIGNLDVEVDSESVRQYLALRLTQKDLSWLSIYEPVRAAGPDAREIQELLDFGIKTIRQLDESISPEFVALVRQTYEDDTEGQTIPGFLRDLMLFHDVERYFSEAWKGNWAMTDHKSVEFLASRYGSKQVADLLSRLEILIDDDGDRA